LRQYLFAPRILDLASRGAIVRGAIALVLRIAAAAITLAALLSWLDVWKVVTSLEASAVVGLVLFQVVFIVATYAVVHTILIRARAIANLPDAEFVILPIVNVCCRLVGECIAWCFIGLAIGGALVVLFADPYAAYRVTREIPFGGYLSPTHGLSGALVYALFGVLSAFAALVFFYLLAESSSLLATIAQNSEIIRTIMQHSGERSEGTI